MTDESYFMDTKKRYALFSLELKFISASADCNLWKRRIGPMVLEKTLISPNLVKQMYEYIYLIL